jgi:NADH dehydrogenase FAD-containing subunit
LIIVAHAIKLSSPKFSSTSLPDDFRFDRQVTLPTLPVFRRWNMSNSSISSKKTIAIVGAGVSGLQAARTILTHPNASLYNVVIFEARNRIGGRVQTKHQWGFPLDFGVRS